MPAYLDPVHNRHHDVENDEVGLDAFGQLQCLIAFLGHMYIEILVLEIEFNSLEDLRLIVYEENSALHLYTSVFFKPY